MRTFITAGILKSIAYNANRGVKNLRVFEMGQVFFSSGEGLPYEYPAICFALTGKERDYFWRDAYSEYDFFDIKGILEGLMERFSLDFSINRSEEPFLNSNRAADIFMDGQKIGWIGEIKEEVLKTYEIEQKVYCAELRFDIIIEKGSSGVKYRQIPRYPQVTRDFSFYIDDKIPVSTLIESIKRVSPLITTVGVFDMFKKEARSISLRVVFQSFEDTLKDGEVNNLQEIIIKELTNIEGVTLRT
jgi:phenylalanyl-tRNA synthetase beta chain